MAIEFDGSKFTLSDIHAEQFKSEAKRGIRYRFTDGTRTIEFIPPDDFSDKYKKTAKKGGIMKKLIKVQRDFTRLAERRKKVVEANAKLSEMSNVSDINNTSDTSSESVKKKQNVTFNEDNNIYRAFAKNSTEIKDFEGKEDFEEFIEDSQEQENVNGIAAGTNNREGVASSPIETKSPPSDLLKPEEK